MEFFSIYNRLGTKWSVHIHLPIHIVRIPYNLSIPSQDALILASMSFGSRVPVGDAKLLAQRAKKKTVFMLNTIVYREVDLSGDLKSTNLWMLGVEGVVHV
jgi:hypothetical protein